MHTLTDFSTYGDQFHIQHVADNRQLLAHIKAERESGNNGWTKNRSMQKIGSIPALEYFKMCKINPELRDANKLEKWLMSSEGAGYRIAEDGRHRAANIIIK